jgi:hypothetical protein
MRLMGLWCFLKLWTSRGSIDIFSGSMITQDVRTILHHTIFQTSANRMVSHGPGYVCQQFASHRLRTRV